MFRNKYLTLSFFSTIKSKIKNKDGFTLVEVVVVVSIILIFTSIIMADQREGEKQFSVQRSAHKLAQDLRRVEEMAMSGHKAPKTFGEVFPRGGYGLYFGTDSNSYILFADCNDNGKYDVGGTALSCASSTEGNAWSEKIDEIFLESGVMISGLSPFSPLNITFFPPDPTITIKSSSEATTTQTTITVSFGERAKTVFINTVGLIDID